MNLPQPHSPCPHSSHTILTPLPTSLTLIPHPQHCALHLYSSCRSHVPSHSTHIPATPHAPPISMLHTLPCPAHIPVHTPMLHPHPCFIPSCPTHIPVHTLIPTYLPAHICHALLSALCTLLSSPVLQAALIHMPACGQCHVPEVLQACGRMSSKGWVILWW